jgi:transcriptional antiterminator RfaH
MSEDSTTWYCVRTRPHKESSVESVLRTRLGLETYYPKWKCKRPVAGTLRWIIRPLFPSYLFAKFDWALDQRRVAYAQDAVQIVSFGGKPVGVGGEFIEQMKSYAVERDQADLFEATRKLQPGDEVVVEAGPFKKLRGLFEKELPDGERVAILLEMLQLQAKVTLPRDYIRPVFLEHPLSAK